MSSESHDSRSFGSAECVACHCDLCDDVAGRGGLLCVPCLNHQITIHQEPEHKPAFGFQNPADLRRCSVCGDPSLDQTGECADWCSADCADAPTCCDFHHAERHTEGADAFPCATWQGGSNYAPNFGENREGDEWDTENELFKSHVQHQIDTDDLNILAILRGWEGLDCAGCGEQLTFEEEGSAVFCSCEECRVGADLDYVFP